MVTRSILRPVLRPVTRAVSDTIRGFNPRSLFSAGEQGIWLDPSDFSTLFQDAAGTTPVTAVGQPVGLALDKRLGLVLGAELVTNGSFSSGTTGWVNNGGIATTFESVTHDGKTNALHVISPAINGGAIQASVFVAASVYSVTYDVKVISGTMYLGISENKIGGIRNTTNSSSWTTVSDTVYGALTNTMLRIYTNEAAEFYVDNISIKEIAGNHAYQTTAPARQTAQSNYLSLDKTDDHLLVAAGGAGTTGFLLVAGIMVPAAGTARTLWSDSGTNAGYKVGIDASNQIVFSAGNGAAFVTATGPALVAGTKYVITAWHDGANLNISVNNGAPTQAAFVTATAGTATITIGKSNSAATEYWGDRIYSIVYRKNDTSNAGQRSSLYSYTVGKMGGL